MRLEFSLASSLLTDCAGVPPDGRLRFYVSRPRLIDAGGEAAPIILEETPFQSESERIALVDLYGDCGEAGAARTGQAVSGQVATGRYDSVEFDLAVPFDRNHANPLTAPPPLNVPSMFWTWQSGYKFLRLDIGTDWSFHLGSTGCVSASAVRPPGSCGQANAATVRLPAAAAVAGVIRIDLDALLAGIDIEGADNCVDAYGDRAHCRQLLARLGLDAGTGRCTDGCAGQSLFRLDSPGP